MVIAPMPSVNYIKAITFGPSSTIPGHEKYTDYNYPERGKVSLEYADATTWNTDGAYDWILFDGGEENPDPEIEEKKFHNLLVLSTQKHLHEDAHFIWKILTPTCDMTLQYLKHVQDVTNRGGLFCCTHSRPTNTELCFISVPRRNLEKDVRNLLLNGYIRAIAEEGVVVVPHEDKRRWHEIDQESIPEIRCPDMSLSIRQLGPVLPETMNTYNHYKPLGIYPRLCPAHGTHTQ